MHISNNRDSLNVWWNRNYLLIFSESDNSIL
uniref:Uncharacterized protein n=1 Tax=Anguilla anguilla TaxID=7936 RepID=A0A0E9VKY1_ANGAN